MLAKLYRDPWWKTCDGIFYDDASLLAWISRDQGPVLCLGPLLSLFPRLRLLSLKISGEPSRRTGRDADWEALAQVSPP